MSNHFKTREEWLAFIRDEMRPHFKAVNAPIPANVRFAIGFTSTGYRSKAIGECWDSTVSGDKTYEIFVKPTEFKPDRVAGILIHELVHAAVGIKEGHKGNFRRVCTALGMTSPMKSSLPGAEMQASVVDPILKRAGALPHATLKAFRIKKQKTRLLKAYCPVCDYTVRVTAKWLNEAGAPFCGHVKHGRMVCDELEEESDE